MNDDHEEDTPPNPPEDEQPSAPEDEALTPEQAELAKQASDASDLNEEPEESDAEKPEKTNKQEDPKPSNSQPTYREIANLMSGEHPDASGARLLFRLGKLVCNLPLEKNGDRVWQIGRDGDQLDLALPNPSMSRRHFQIRYDQKLDEFLIADRRSHNGTFHNRRPLDREGQEEPLGRGDWILAGGHYFLFVEEETVF